MKNPLVITLSSALVLWVGGVSAEPVSEAEFAKLLAESGTQANSDEPGEEYHISVANIDASSLYENLDQKHLYLRELNLAIEIAEAQQRLEEVTGTGVVHAAVPNAEIESLTRQLQLLEARLEESTQSFEPPAMSTEAAKESVENKKPLHSDWFVARMAVTEEGRWAIIYNGRYLSERLKVGDKLDGATIASIEPWSVSARSGGKRFDIPMRPDMRLGGVESTETEPPAESFAQPSVRALEAQRRATQQHLTFDSQGEVVSTRPAIRDSASD